MDNTQLPVRYILITLYYLPQLGPMHPLAELNLRNHQLQNIMNWSLKLPSKYGPVRKHRKQFLLQQIYKESKVRNIQLLSFQQMMHLYVIVLRPYLLTIYLANEHDSCIHQTIYKQISESLLTKGHIIKSMNHLDYYQIMQVQRTASVEEIKKAYKQLALKHHPDKNQDKVTSTVMFTKLTQAYAVLSDPKKRTHYDQFGTNQQPFQDFTQFMPYSVFQDFFNTAVQSSFFNFMNAFSKNPKSKGKRVKNKNANYFFQNLLKQQTSSSQQEQDCDDLTEQQTAALEFGRLNTQPSKKNKLKCKLDGKCIAQDDILMHFTQNHKKQILQYMNNVGK